MPLILTQLHTSHTRLEFEQTLNWHLKVTHQTLFRFRGHGDQNVTNHTFECLNFYSLSPFSAGYLDVWLVNY